MIIPSEMKNKEDVDPLEATAAYTITPTGLTQCK